MAAGNTAYRYDAENQRLSVSVDGQKTRYVINAQLVLSQASVGWVERAKPILFVDFHNV